MPIQLITGTPGAGKTLLALEATLKEGGVKDRSSLKAIMSQLHEEHAETKITRPIVVCGVEGLHPDLFMEMENPLEWQQFEDGTLFLVDEAWKWFGVQCKDAAKDPRFLALAEHRHRGMDFIMTAQMPVQLLPHLRGLVSPHVHVTRKFGTKTTVTYEWSSVQSNPNSQTSKSIAQEKLWMQPKPIYDLYQSATLHTIKRKIPLKVIMIPIVAVLALGAVGGALWAATSFIGRGVSAKPGSSAAAGTSSVKLKPGEVISTDQFKAIRAPRIEDIPSSAPIFDGRQVRSYPKIYCMSVGHDGVDSCRCVTEQNTRLIVAPAKCRDIARWGPVYDEYIDARPQRDQASNRDEGAGRRPADTAGNAGAPLTVTPIPGEQVSGYGAPGVGATPAAL